MREHLLGAFCAFAVVLLVTGCVGTPDGEHTHSDHPVYIENLGTESATIDITVVRNATGETVHNQRYEVDPGEEREIYNTDRASPTGVETFEIRYTARNETKQVTVQTNQCFGSAHVVIQADGTPSSYYTTCRVDLLALTET